MKKGENFNKIYITIKYQIEKKSFKKIKDFLLWVLWGEAQYQNRGNLNNFF